MPKKLRPITDMATPAKVYFFFGALLILTVLCYITCFEGGTVWLSLAFRDVLSYLFASVLLLLGGSILLDLAVKEKNEKR